MAQQPLLGFTTFPTLWYGINAGVGASAYTLDATGEKAAVIFQIPADGNITNLGFRTSTVTTGDTMKIGLYTVDASGNPTTTAYKGMVAGTQVVADIDDNTYFNVTLGTQATSVVKGDIVALVIEYNSYVAGNMGITTITSTGGSALAGFPYGDLYLVSWTKQSTLLAVTIEYSGGVYYPILGILPLGSAGVSFVNANVNTATFDEYGIRINIPIPARAVGIWAALYGNTNADFEAILYEGTTALKTIAHDGDYTASVGTVTPFFLFFSTAQDLTANTNYYIAIRPTTTTNLSFYFFTAPSVAAAAQFHGGAGAYRVKRLNQGAWTEETTIIAHMGIILDAFSDGVGGGGGGMPILRGSVVGG